MTRWLTPEAIAAHQALYKRERKSARSEARAADWEYATAGIHREGASACGPRVASHGESACGVKVDSEARCGAPDPVAAPQRGGASITQAASAKAPAGVVSPALAGQRPTPSAPSSGLPSRPAHAAPAAAQLGTLTLPWPPTGNSAVRHANGAHYLRPEVLTYRAVVAAACEPCPRVSGRYILHVHLSPPDARARDMDNALKTLNDALVKCGYLPSDAMTYMRELHVTTDDRRAGKAYVRTEPA